MLRDNAISGEEKHAVPGILGMNVLSEIHSLFDGLEGLQVVQRHTPCLGG